MQLFGLGALALDAGLDLIKLVAQQAVALSLFFEGCLQVIEFGQAQLAAPRQLIEFGG